MKKVEWISEKEAAEKLQRKERTIRTLVKSGKWPIAYSSLNGRRYHYDLKGIERLMMENSTAL